MFDRIIRGMAYPDSGILCFLNQTTYEDVRRYAKDLDIVYARTLGYDNDQFELPTDWLNWKPTAHHDNSIHLSLSDIKYYIPLFRPFQL